MRLLRLAAVAGVGFTLTGAGATTGAPVAVGAPTITGIAVSGQTLSVKSGLWEGRRPLTLAFQWQRCGRGACVPVQGVSGRRYLIASADVGATVVVEVTATNAVGSANASSAPTAVVSATPRAGATPLPAGGFSLPIASVAPPDRLLVTTGVVRTGQAGSALVVRVQVSDVSGYSIAGALVSLTALPVGLFKQPAAAATNSAGSVAFLLQPVPHAWLAKSLVPAVFVRADFPGATTPSPIAGSVLGQLGPAPAAPAGNPYLPWLTGYDLSYPNCSSRPAAQPAFAIVGVNGGRPFTFNPCLRLEASWFARGPQAVYLNTGYQPSFRHQITPACAFATAPSHGAAIAYAIGCSEAAASLERTTLLGLSPTIWWLDVEPSNAWSANPTINIGVIRGILDFLDKLTPSPLIGIYSSPSWWHQITDGWPTTVPEWIPAQTTVCPSPFSNGPVWLAQTGSATLDVDAAC
jgi:hypothetical protein